MNIILLENIDELGTVGQEVRVKDGYARNYLLPQKLACLANSKNRNFYRSKIEAEQKKLAKARETALTQKEKIEQISLTFTRKSKDADTRLFGSVTNADVASALQEKGYEIDKRRVTLSEPIKKTGEYTATIRLHPEVTSEINVLVEAEEQGEQ
jgi:large subunit ribosomal protein L9